MESIKATVRGRLDNDETRNRELQELCCTEQLKALGKILQRRRNLLSISQKIGTLKYLCLDSAPDVEDPTERMEFAVIALNDKMKGIVDNRSVANVVEVSQLGAKDKLVAYGAMSGNQENGATDGCLRNFGRGVKRFGEDHKVDKIFSPLLRVRKWDMQPGDSGSVLGRKEDGLLGILLGVGCKDSSAYFLPIRRMIHEVLHVIQQRKRQRDDDDKEEQLSKKGRVGDPNEPI
eukprot:scaffold1513_cov164-Pinguiococcus_pyrenoidosus.AAC.5